MHDGFLCYEDLLTFVYGERRDSNPFPSHAPERQIDIMTEVNLPGSPYEFYGDDGTGTAPRFDRPHDFNMQGTIMAALSHINKNAAIMTLITLAGMLILKLFG